MKEDLAMHMQREHNGAAPVQKSFNMCLFTSHLSHVLKNQINRKHLGILKTFECDKCDCSAKNKGSIMNILSTTKKPPKHVKYATKGHSMLNI